MKKLFKLTLAGIILLFLLTACGANTTECYESVQDKYPDSEIVLIPGEIYRFLVITADEIRYIETMSTWNTSITSDVPAIQLYKLDKMRGK